MKTFFTSLIVLFSFSYYCAAQRLHMELSSPDGWKVWLDEKAKWKEDKLFLPDELELSDVPVNLPTCCWTDLYKNRGKDCGVPTTVEEQFGTAHDWSYHGVSWFYREFEVSPEWKNKKGFLTIEKYTHRVEVFVNEQLVGYDAIGLLPYQCDITDVLKPGEKTVYHYVSPRLAVLEAGKISIR